MTSRRIAVRWHWHTDGRGKVSATDIFSPCRLLLVLSLLLFMLAPPAEWFRPPCCSNFLSFFKAAFSCRYRDANLTRGMLGGGTLGVYPGGDLAPQLSIIFLLFVASVSFRFSPRFPNLIWQQCIHPLPGFAFSSLLSLSFRVWYSLFRPRNSAKRTPTAACALK